MEVQQLNTIDPVYTQSWLDTKLNLLMKQAIDSLEEAEGSTEKGIIASTYADILYFFGYYEAGSNASEIETKIWSIYDQNDE